MVKRRSLILWLLIIGLLPLFPLQAEPLEEGVQAYQEGRWDEAFTIWLPLAEQGDKRAQLFLGEIYLTGRGVEADPEKARQWLQRSAEQGFAPAQFNLGNYYREGLGGPVDYEAAGRWWRLAAEQDFLGAQYNLGYMYANGHGVERSESEARYWYGRAAAKGLERAREALARMDPEAGPPAGSDELQSFDAAVAEGGEWLERQPAGSYTIQLLASTNLDACLDSGRAAGRALGSPVHLVRHQVGAGNYCVLLYGSFPDREQARAGLESLPPPLRRNKPWLRRFEQLRASTEER